MGENIHEPNPWRKLTWDDNITIFTFQFNIVFLFVIVYYWGGEVSLKTIFNHISHHFMVAGVQEDWDDVTKYTNLLSQCIPLSLIKFQILDPFSSVPIQIMRYFRHFDSLFFAPLWDLPAPIGNKSGSRDKIADQSRVGHVIQNSAQSQASTRMSWAWGQQGSFSISNFFIFLAPNGLKIIFRHWSFFLYGGGPPLGLLKPPLGFIDIY